MRKLVIFSAFIASLTGVCAAAVHNHWLTTPGNQAQQRNSAGTDGLNGLRNVALQVWLDGATEALGRW
jgi:hypothetical protein